MSPKFPIPDEALDDRLAILGTAGSGKTYLALTAIERLLARGARVIFVDPLGVGWGLRLDADGKKASSFNVPIFGGSHGDIALTEHAGAVIGETVAKMRESCIVDLSGLGTKASERRFMLAFLTSLYRNATKDPVHLIVDESDMFAPQRLMDREGDAAKLLGMMETIVRRGRVSGFIPWLITQRPAVLSKDVLSQADGLVALKLTSSQDRDAIGAWIEGQADKADAKAILASLPGMDRGQGVVWLPGRGILETVCFPAKRTFDSSRTPKRGEKLQATELKPLDLASLKDRLAKVETEAKANDPKVLKVKLAAAEAELAKLRKLPAPSNVAAKSNVPDQKAYERALAAAHEEGAQAVRDTIPAMLDAQHQASFQAGFEFLAARRAVFEPDFVPARKPLPRIQAALKGAKVPSKAPSSPISARFAPSKPRAAVAPTPAAPIDGLTTPQSRVLQSLAFWLSIGHDNPTREQVAAVAGYRPGSGNFNNIIGSLSSAGHTSVPEPGRLNLLTDIPAPSAEEAQAKLWSVFENPQRKLVEAALAADGDMSRDELAIAAGYAPGSGNFNNICGSLTSMDVLQRTGQSRIGISDWAREVLAE